VTRAAKILMRSKLNRDTWDSVIELLGKVRLKKVEFGNVAGNR
jgi:hypothetical protein